MPPKIVPVGFDVFWDALKKFSLKLLLRVGEKGFKKIYNIQRKLLADFYKIHKNFP